MRTQCRVCHHEIICILLINKNLFWQLRITFFFFINKCENKLIYFFFLKIKLFLPQYNIFLNLYRFNCYHVYSLIIAFTNKCLPTHHSDRDISVINRGKKQERNKTAIVFKRHFNNDKFWDRNPNYDTMINISLFTNKLMSSSKRRNIFY